jgi:CBS-domain-containing membrane protein
MIRPSLGMVLRALGAAGAMALMMTLSDWSSQPLDGVPFATSIVLVMAVPEAEFSRPRNVLVGHLLCAACGVLATHLPPGPWQVPAAFAAAVLLMLVTRTMHPPAGINALLPVTHDYGWGFLLNPVLVGAVLLVGYAFAFSWLARYSLSSGQIGRRMLR